MTQKQAAQAADLLDGHEIFVSLTVLLETELVLRSVYGYPAGEVAGALGALAGLPRMAIENPNTAGLALRWLAGGLDFADGLHLASAQTCDAFVTFDRTLEGGKADPEAARVRASENLSQKLRADEVRNLVRRGLVAYWVGRLWVAP